MKEPNMFHNHETEKITRKASDVAENLQLYRVVRFAWDHYAFNVILWTPADICIVHNDLGWKNRTTRYNCRFSATSVDTGFTSDFRLPKSPPIYASCMMISGGRTEQHVIICFGELAAVN